MDLVALAKAIRGIRTQKRMTLQEVADRAKVSKSLISRIENFRATPSLPVLVRIADGLGVSAGELLENVSTSSQEVVVVREAERKALLRNPERKHLSYFELAGAEQNKSMLPLIINIASHKKAYRPMRHEGEEFSLVLKGRVRFVVGGEERLLRRGDSIYFSAQVEHSLYCAGPEPARIMSIMCGMGESAGA